MITDLSLFLGRSQHSAIALRALLQYIPFDNWDHLMRFMLAGLEEKFQTQSKVLN